ncbi:FCD domain-containing protein [Rhodobacteraceae bacterium 2CG4]|uniref:FCD domain-containing protein n=1 Tax=Halovulum marinum TaxID=2662447 RepID=A0A6L5Z2J4_9RHOB|nr:GntR family transcriptional regulator [Halovulum marinum]MSU90758.1 FCD domain-containing protein [Halovulum marinum]
MVDLDQASGLASIEQESVSKLLSDVKLVAEKPLVHQIVESVRRLIITVRLLPGQKISESALSAAFDASKTPVREALIRLEAAGLVNIVPKSGTFVAPIRIEKYFDAFFIRLHLETGAVRRAAAMARAGQPLDPIDRVMERQERALSEKDYDLFFALDEHLHQGIFDMAGISGVWETARRAQTELYRVRHLKRICTLQRGPVILAQHQDLVAAIRSGEPDAAEAALVAHVGSLEQEADVIWSAPGLIENIERLNAERPRPRLR